MDYPMTVKEALEEVAKGMEIELEEIKRSIPNSSALLHLEKRCTAPCQLAPVDTFENFEDGSFILRLKGSKVNYIFEPASFQDKEGERRKTVKITTVGLRSTGRLKGNVSGTDPVRYLEDSGERG